MKSTNGARLAASLSLLALVLTACGNDTKKDTTATSAPTTSGTAGAASTTPSVDKSKTIVVGAANFGESEILANMYAKVLEKAGYKTDIKKGNLDRPLLSKAMLAGEISLVAEYVGTDTEYWNKEINGKDAPAKASSDLEATVTALTDLLAKKDLVAYTASPAADQNAFAVTKKTAEAKGLKTMSDLSKVAKDFTLGGPPECPVRPFCQPGLQKTYGLKFKAFKPLDPGGPLTKNALADGKIDVGLVFSSDGGVVARGFTVLEDDKKLQTADNVIPVLRKDVDSPEVKAALDGVSAKLTTEALQGLNKQVDIDKADAAAVAEKWLKDNGLL
jgi:osmoprotectant transport system substrate-binding protein